MTPSAACRCSRSQPWIRRARSSLSSTRSTGCCALILLIAALAGARCSPHSGSSIELAGTDRLQAAPRRARRARLRLLQVPLDARGAQGRADRGGRERAGLPARGRHRSRGRRGGGPAYRGRALHAQKLARRAPAALQRAARRHEPRRPAARAPRASSNCSRNDIIRYGDRHRVKSGITGWAQVNGLRGQTSLAERVEWDNYYIAHWSLGLDLEDPRADAGRALPQRGIDRSWGQPALRAGLRGLSGVGHGRQHTRGRPAVRPSPWRLFQTLPRGGPRAAPSSTFQKTRTAQAVAASRAARAVGSRVAVEARPA